MITSNYPSLFSEIYRRYINWQRSRVRRFTFVVRGKNKPKKYYSSVQNSASREEIFPLLKGRGWSVGWERKGVMLWRNKLSKLYAHTSIKVRDRLLVVWFFFQPSAHRRRTRKHAWILNVSKCLLWYLFMCLFFPLFVLYWEMESRFTSFFQCPLGFFKGRGGVLLCFWNVHVTIRVKAVFL